MNRLECVTRPLMWFMAMLLAAVAAGCGGSGGGIGGGAPILGLPSVVSFAVSPVTASIPITGTQQFKATATYSDGSSRDVTATSAWTSGTPAIATIIPATGLATGISAGTSVITATLGIQTATANLTVNAATSVSFKVAPTTATIPVSGTQQFAAIQTFSDGSTIDRTATSVWSTSGGSAANATVGAATGLAVGVTVTPVAVPVIVNASFTPLGGVALVATPATLIVNAATSVSLVVKPTTASTSVGSTQQFAVIQTFSDGTTFDRTLSSVWSTSGVSAANATVGAATGIVTAVTATPAGLPVIINASYTPLGGVAIVATPASLTVSAATSVSFAVKPVASSIPVGGTMQFTAIETFSDGTTIDRTPTSVWTTSGVSAANASVGGATGLALGITVTPAGLPVVINASYTPLGGVAHIATPATLIVTSAPSVSFKVMPVTATVLLGRTQQYAAIETFSDGSIIDRTATSVWTTSGVSAANATIGVATGLATGVTVTPAGVPVIINATYTPLGGVPLVATPANLIVTAPNYGPALTLPDFKTATPYGILAWDAMTINLGSHIYGDVALTGGVMASVVGPGTKDGGVAPNLTASAVTNSTGVTPGIINTSDNGALSVAQMAQLHADLNAAFLDLMGRAAPVTALTTIASATNVPGGTFAAATDLSGYILSPGIYTTAVAYGLSSTSGPLVLDAGGNPDAVFIIRSTSAASGLTSTTGSVVLQGGAQAKNVFWVFENATIGNGASTFFQGTLVAGQVITLGTFTNVQGRMLAGARGLVSGAITLTGTNIVTVPK